MCASACVGPPRTQTDTLTRAFLASAGAAIIVNLVTLTGLVLLVPAIKSVVEQYPIIFTVTRNAFAAGALLAAAFFLMLYESTHLIPIDENNTEAEASAAWGCMILLGFLTSTLIDSMMAALSPNEPSEALEPAQAHMPAAIRDSWRAELNFPGKGLHVLKVTCHRSINVEICLRSKVRLVESEKVGRTRHDRVLSM